MLVLFAILIFIYNFAATLYALTGVEPLPTFEFLYLGAFPWAAVWWFRSETRKSDVQRVYCHGLLINIGWFVIIPYHLFKTRGWKGLLPVLALVGTWLTSLVMAAIVYAVFLAPPTAF
jgi:hypothetical protein